MLELLPSSVSAILAGVGEWRHKRSLSSADKEKRLKAVNEVMRAAVATKAYVYDKRELGQTSRDRELQLSDAWQIAAGAIYAFDRDLFESSKVKSLGWADPKEWGQAETEAVTVNIDKIIEQCEWMRNSLDEET